MGHVGLELYHESGNDYTINSPTIIRSFEEGLAVRGVVAKKSFYARNRGLFSVPFFLCLLRRKEKHITEMGFSAVLGVCLSPTLSRQPLFETSEIIDV